MCRFLAYRGEPIFLSDLVCAPTHSLVHQSLHAEEAKSGTNGDGFGIGWYGERPEPGLYREIRPAWSDENLKSLCEQVRSGLFFAHVRASTGTSTTRANCHPFAYGRHLFMHNGQIGGYARIKRRLEAMIPDDLYDARLGTTDSEAIFLAALADGLTRDAVAAMARTLKTVRDLMTEAGVEEPLRFTAACTDGESLWAYRWACDGQPPTLYYRETDGHLLVVSEPIDGRDRGWREVPKGCVLVARAGGPAAVECLKEAMSRVAA
jgi:predicted glutamine amidotransferase